MVVTALNLLPAGRLEGGRIAQAMVGRGRAGYLSLGTTFTLGAFGFGGSVLSLSWALFVTFFRRGEELPARNEISELGGGRFLWGSVLALLCFLTLFPNSAGTFPSVFYTPPFWRNDFWGCPNGCGKCGRWFVATILMDVLFRTRFGSYDVLVYIHLFVSRADLSSRGRE